MLHGAVSRSNACNRSAQGAWNPRGHAWLPRARRAAGPVGGALGPCSVGCESLPSRETQAPPHLGPWHLRTGREGFVQAGRDRSQGTDGLV